MFTFSAGDLDRGCLDTQCLIRSGAGLTWVGSVAQYEDITEKCVREGRVPPVKTSDCEGVLFTHELVDALLSFLGKVTIGEMVAVKARMDSAVKAIKDGEGGAR